ncbi:hypothetical protein [Roseicyclus sp.]|uniref:hypothetical protein n=1 Tax=Roseicyclus sp. TaxID=1914329 RepID=UPI003F9EE93C
MISRRLALALALALSPMAALSQGANEIPYRESVTLSVGESAVIYGYRGECGQLPGAGEVRVPALSTGTLSIGRPGQRQSRRCGGTTPAVEIIFTATTPGRETFELQGDRIRVRVRN